MFIVKTVVLKMAAALILAPILHAQQSDTPPDREHFLKEVLEPAATAVTSKFDDYTAGSYHVNKLDLLKGLEPAATNSTNRLRAVIVMGPSGVMWSYEVLAFQDRPDGVRVNQLVFSHARIVSKRTKTIAESEFQRILENFKVPDFLVKGDPSTLRTSEQRPLEQTYDLLAAVWTMTERTTYFREIKRNSLNPGLAATSKNSEEFLKRLDDLMLKAITTYPAKK